RRDRKRPARFPSRGRARRSPGRYGEQHRDCRRCRYADPSQLTTPTRASGPCGRRSPARRCVSGCDRSRVAVSLCFLLLCGECASESRSALLLYLCLPSRPLQNLFTRLFSCFAWLQLDRNTRITHALAFVSIGLAKLVHLGCDLAQLLLVDTGQRQRRLILLNTSLRRETLSF